MDIRISVMAAAAICGALAISSARAQDNASGDASAGDSDKLETIVVTAQRRSEDVERVPIAISAVSGNTLAAAGISNVVQLAPAVPGLNLVDNVDNTQVFIRGVGTTALSVENDVGVYIDGVYITSQTGSLLNLSNIDRVEVLKGPQGTLFGRNAIGGALQIVTKDPSQTPSADISVGYGNYDTTNFNFYGTTGLTSNLATDFAAYYSDQADGWGHNLATGVPTFRAHSTQLRNKWVYTPTESTKVTLALDYGHTNNELGANWHILPGSYGVGGYTYPGFYNSNSNGLSQNEAQQDGVMIRIDQDFGWARGVSISAERNSTNHAFTDQDATPLPLVEGGPTPQNDRSFSQELQLLSPESSKIKWILGGYYLYDRYYTPGFGITVGTTTHEVLVVDEPTKSFAEFAQATVEVLPDTHLTAGLRYTDDRKSVSGNTFVNGIELPQTIPGTTSPASQSESFSKLTYRVVLDHQITPDMLGYVSYDTGFKSGQFNLIAYADPAVRPESLDAWQAGLKSEFMDHRLRVNLAGFHYDYTNIQITEVVPGGTELLNAAAAKIYGADLDFNALITPSFKIQGAASWLHGRYTDFPDAPSYVPAGLPAGGNTLITIDAAGNHTVQSPDATAYLAGDYTAALANAGKIDLNVNVSYNSGYYWDPNNRVKQPPFALLGAYAKWSPAQQNWDVSLWANNITGRKYYSYETAFQFGDIASPAAPTTYGVTLHAHF